MFANTFRVSTMQLDQIHNFGTHDVAPVLEHGPHASIDVALVPLVLSFEVDEFHSTVARKAGGGCRRTIASPSLIRYRHHESVRNLKRGALF